MGRSNKNSTRNAGKKQSKEQLNANDLLIKPIDFNKFLSVFMINEKPAYALQTESVYSRNYIGLQSARALGEFA